MIRENGNIQYFVVSDNCKKKYKFMFTSRVFKGVTRAVRKSSMSTFAMPHHHHHHQSHSMTTKDALAVAGLGVSFLCGWGAGWVAWYYNAHDCKLTVGGSSSDSLEASSLDDFRNSKGDTWQ